MLIWQGCQCLWIYVRSYSVISYSIVQWNASSLVKGRVCQLLLTTHKYEADKVQSCRTSRQTMMQSYKLSTSLTSLQVIALFNNDANCCNLNEISCCISLNLHQNFWGKTRANSSPKFEPLQRSLSWKLWRRECLECFNEFFEVRSKIANSFLKTFAVSEDER